MHLSTNLQENFTCNHENQNEEFNNFFVIFKSSVDHNVPLINLSRKLTKLPFRPWIPKGLLNSIKTKNKLYKKVMNIRISYEFQKYKNFTAFLLTWKRKLNSIITKSSCLRTPILHEKLGKQSIRQLVKLCWQFHSSYSKHCPWCFLPSTQPICCPSFESIFYIS